MPVDVDGDFDGAVAELVFDVSRGFALHQEQGRVGVAQIVKTDLTQAGWERNPFKLAIEGDRLYARGVTDCLGHVALLTDYFIQLAEKKPRLRPSISAVLIANEENSEVVGVGIDELVRRGKLEHLKGGPVYWLDSADIQPSIGTGSGIGWSLKIKGKLFHSGMADKAINALELAMEAVRLIQSRFYQDFPPHPDEKRYLFAIGSTLSQRNGASRKEASIRFPVNARSTEIFV